MTLDSERTTSSQGRTQPGDQGNEFLRDGGQMGELLRSKDWSQSELGPPQQWPNSLKTAVQIMLNSRYPMFIWWGPRLINLYNDSYAPFLGNRHPQALGIPAQDSWWEIWDQVGPQTEQVMKEGRATWNEEVLLVMERHGFPEETYFTWSYSPIQDDRGGLGGVFCAVTEDTARVLGQRRVRTLRALATRTALARTAEQACEIAAATIAENRNDVPCGLIYLLDESKNQARLHTLFGMERGHPNAPEVVDLNKPSEIWPFQAVMQSRELEVAEFPSSGPPVHGSPRPDSVRSAVVMPISKAGQERLAGFMVAGVSPLRKLDDDYRGFYGLLAGHVETAIANADAYEAERKRAEALAEIDRAKTRFFSNVSHEFRTPLTLMLAPLEDLLALYARALRLNEYEQLAVVHRNGLRLLKLVNTLLDFSRIEAGRVQANYEATDLSAFTADLASVFRSAMEKAGLEYRVEVEPLVEPVYVDRHMWEKIVLNLLSNAFKFTFRGEVSLHLRQLEDGVEFSVRDTGTGIPEQELPRVFERFHRIEGAEGRTYEGTGIGLALVQELVNLHSGTVHVASKYGQGSTFTVTIPRGRQHLPAAMVERRRSGDPALHRESYVEELLSYLPASSGEDESAAEKLPASLVARTESATAENPSAPLILLADDNADLREYLRRLLKDKYRVHAVANGREALSMARKLGPDLILSDVMMPLLDGFGLLQEIRNDEALRGTPVILLSARAGEEARVDGLEAGADDYLVKPFTARELLARVGTHLSMARLRKQAVDTERQLWEKTELEHKRLHAALSASHSGTYRWDPAAGELMEFDREVAELFGFSPEQRGLLVKDFLARIHPEDLPLAHAAIEGCRAGKDVDFEFRVVLPDGSIRWIYDRGKMEWEDGRPPYLVGALTDITERKLAQQALVQTEKLASVGRLAATVAHEINNPLEAVTNLIYLAQHDTAISSKAAKYLAMADEELRRVAELTRQTLGFYRQPSGWALTQAGPILEQLLNLFARRISSKRLKVKLKIKADPEVLAVSSELRQLFANLVNNSIDAVQEGGSLTLGVSRARDRSGMALLRVSIGDSGPGISPEMHGRVFEPFFTTKDQLGTGLGLWVSKTIAEKHGGRIQIRSNNAPGKSWTVMSVTLPIYSEKVNENRAAPRSIKSA